MDNKLQEIVINECKKYLSSKIVNSIVNNINNNYNELKNIVNNDNNINIDDIITNELTNKVSINTNQLVNNEYDISIYTDGACSGNGKTTATAGLGIYIDKFIDNKIYKINKKINNITFSYNEKTKEKTNPDKYIKYNCSNIRAEGYAILYSLMIIKYKLVDKIDILNELNKYLIEEKSIYPSDKYDFIYNNKNIINSKKYNVIINTDSEFWINVITKWMSNWIKKGTVFDKKNIDLVIYIYYNYNILKQNNINIIFNHVKGHPESTKKDISTFNKDESGIYNADKMAVLSKNNINSNFNIIL